MNNNFTTDIKIFLTKLKIGNASKYTSTYNILDKRFLLILVLGIFSCNKNKLSRFIEAYRNTRLMGPCRNSCPEISNRGVEKRVYSEIKPEQNKKKRHHQFCAKSKLEISS